MAIRIHLPLPIKMDEIRLLGMAFGFLIVWMLIALAITVVLLVAEWKMFVKAGKPGWAVLIPIYNIYTQAEFSWNHKMAVVLAWLEGAALILSGMNSYVALLENEIAILTMAIITLIVGMTLFVLNIVLNYKTLECFGIETIGCVLGAFFFGIATLIVGYSKGISYTPPKQD